MRSSHLLLLLVASLGLGSANRAATSAPNSRPNILILLADDFGQRDVGCYNAETFYETPHLDRLARQGVRFTDGYAANPVCSPTRYSIMTGKWPTRASLTNFLHGSRIEKFQGAPLVKNMSLDEVTLAEALRASGYRTVFTGKWHLGEDETNWPEHQGFDVNIAGNKQGQPGSWFSPYKNPRITDGPPGEFLTDRLASETIAQLKKAKETGEPVLVCHFFYQVHTPLKAPAELIKKYEAKAARLGLQEKFSHDSQYHLSAKDAPRRVRQNQTLPVYAAMVESIDTATGRILAALDELGLAENTLVIFTSDNGGLSTSEGLPTANLPFRGGKGWVYEGGIREPFMVRWPGVAKAGAVSREPVTSLDIYPTVLAAAGVAQPASMPSDGRDLRLALEGETTAARDLFWHYPHYSNQGGFPGGAIRSGDWKLIENYEDGSVALYNLAHDIGEQDDLAAKESARVTAMRSKLHTWYRATGAQFLRAKADGPAAWSPNAQVR